MFEKKNRLTLDPILDLDDLVYIYEPFFGRVIEYTVMCVIRNKDGIRYSLDAYDKYGDLINYRSIDQDQIGKTVYLTLADAQPGEQNTLSLEQV